MTARPVALAVALLIAACSSADDPDDPGDAELPSLRATVQMSGRERDASVTVVACEDSPEPACQWQVVLPDGEVTFSSLAPGDYLVFLYDVASNCALVGDEWILGVRLQDSTVTVGFDIQCQGPGTVRVSAVTSGTNLPPAYEVLREDGCDDYYHPCDRKGISSSGSVSADFVAFPGSQTFRLTDLPDNCDVIAPGNPATVTAIEDSVAELRFEVACQ